jgi:hypothetical protein
MIVPIHFAWDIKQMMEEYSLSACDALSLDKYGVGHEKVAQVHTVA